MSEASDKKLGWRKAIGKSYLTRHARTHSRTDARDGMDKWMERLERKRREATTAAATDHEDVAAPKMTGAADQLEAHNAAATGGHRWELPGNYPVFAVVMVIYHYVERIWRILVAPNFLYNIYNH